MCNIRTIQVISFFAALIVSSCQQSEPTQTSPQQTALPVHIEKVSQSRQMGSLVYSGDIRPLRVSNANFTIPGKVIFLPHETGDFVRQGQSIGLLDSADYHIEMKRTQAQLMEAEDLYKRYKQLYEKESLPEKEYISAQAAYQQALAGLEMIQKRITDTQLHAPSTGLIMEKNAEVGSSVSNDMAVYRIATLNPAYAEISVPEVEIGKIKVGQAATVVIPTLNHKEFTGTVKIIPPVANPQTRTFPVKILLQNPNYLIKGGMIAEVTLTIKDTLKNESLSIPSEAVLRSPDETSYVFVADLEQKKAQRRRVSVGSIQGEAVEVIDGLTDEDWIIVAGQHKLRDGQAIQIDDKQLVSINP